MKKDISKEIDKLNKYNSYLFVLDKTSKTLQRDYIHTSNEIHNLQDECTKIYRGISRQIISALRRKRKGYAVSISKYPHNNTYVYVVCNSHGTKTAGIVVNVFKGQLYLIKEPNKPIDDVNNRILLSDIVNDYLYNFSVTCLKNNKSFFKKNPFFYECPDDDHDDNDDDIYDFNDDQEDTEL